MLPVTDSSLRSERTLMKRINQWVSEANDNADQNDNTNLAGYAMPACKT